VLLVSILLFLSMLVFILGGVIDDVGVNDVVVGGVYFCGCCCS
jgi:hypothetical protein